MRNRLLQLVIPMLFLAFWTQAQNVTVNPGGGSYADLAGAFTAINNGTHTGAITINIVGNTTEPAGGAILNASGSGSASYTSILIQPSGGISRTISGAATVGLPLIDFNGADNVVINGLNTGGNSLTFENTTVSATSGTSTIRFQADATGNTITNCSILGASTMAVGTNGGNIWFGAAAITTGNDNNTISNCNIGPSGSNLPTKGIYFSGTTTNATLNNSGITISNNNIFDYFGAAVTSAGVYITSGTTDITISNNKFYQTASRTQTTGGQHSGIWISNTSGNNFLITANIIGYASSAQTGTYTFVGTTSSVFIPVFLSVGTTTASSVQGNTIASIAMSGSMSGTSSSSAFRGIYVSSGLTTIGDVTGNTIGSQTETGSITYTSSSTSASDVIGIFNFGSSAWTTNNNTIGGITVSNSSTGAANVYGLRCFTASTVTWTCNNNIIGGSVANSLRSTSTATGTVVQGILNTSPAGTITGNTIRNLTAAGGTGTTSSASVVGICITASSANHTISQNTIFNLNNTNVTDATIVTGIQYTGSTGSNIVERNLIYGLTSSTSSAAAEINGIRVAGGTTLYRNNMIALGAGVTNALGAAATNSGTTGINGINEFLGTNQFFHNSVYIGGAPTAGTGASYAFNGTQTINTRSFRDNIFFNARNNSGATGKNYAVKINGTVPNPTGLTINNNIYFANGSGGVFGFFNSLDVANIAAWRTAVGQDAGSFESNPQFLDPTNALPDLHLHPTNPTVAEGNGADVGVTNDFDGQVRSGLTPVDIGADAGNYNGIDLAGPIIAYTAFTNSCSTTARTLTATITDASGVPTSGIGLPVLYWRIGAGAWNAATASWVSGNSYNFTFGGGVIVGDVVSYYIVAQDNLAPVPNVSAFPDGGAGGFTYNPPAAATPPTTPSSYTIQNNLAAGVYGVGGPAAPGEIGHFTTLTSAIAAYNASCLGGAITFMLTDPAYSTPAETFPITINSNSFASAVNTLTIRPAPGNTPSIEGSSASSIFWINGADYVIIDGSNSGGTDRSLNIKNTAATSNSAVIWVSSLGNGAGATNNTLKNINITAGEVGTTTSINTFGIFVGGLSISNTGSGPDNDNLTIRNNLIKKARYGIFAKAADLVNTNNNLQIISNTIGSSNAADYVTFKGIEIAFAEAPVISQNNIFNLRMALSANNAGIECGSGVNNSQIVRNTISGIYSESTSGYGAYGINFSSSTSVANNLIANNFITDIRTVNYSTGSTTWNAFGIRLTGGTGTKVLNNSVNLFGNITIVSGTPTQPNSAAFIVTATAVTGLVVKNNIFRNTQNFISGSPKIYSIWLPDAYTGMAGIDNNDYFGTNGPSGNPTTYHVGRVGSIDYTTLAAWQGYTSQDANSENVNPVFISDLDLHLVAGSNPLLAGGGVTVPEVSIDIDGGIRPNPPTIGAHELNPVPPCPPLTVAPPNVDITNSTCQSGCQVGGGLIQAPTGSPCPSGSTLQYQVNGGAWTNTLPVYQQEGPAQTIKTRCSCDLDPLVLSPESNPATTVPGTCIDPVSPVIEIVDNICPSTEGTISASGCITGTVLEWAFTTNGPWSETTPVYTTTPLTVYARCQDNVTGCLSDVVSDITNPQPCEPEPECPQEAKLVISQVYGGGGNSGSTYRNDFIELFNAGNISISLSGMSVQYGSATGSSWQVTPISGSLNPGQYYLIQEAQGGAGTTPLPTPDAVGSIAMSATAGKVALVTTTTALSGTCPTGAQILDFVGYGTTANCFEGSGPTPAPSNTNAVLRADDGCIDTDNNASDFTAGLPTPRNTASPIHICGIDAPVITIVDNECPSTEGSITAEGCGEAYVLEWALSEEGPWSETAPDYTTDPITVYARCRDEATNCTSPVANATTDPTDCSAFECAITSISISNISECDDNETIGSSDDIFTADITVTYVNSPETGALSISGDAVVSENVINIGETTHTFIGVIMSANGGVISLSAVFTDDPDCQLTNENAGTAPNSCSIEPTIVNYGGPTITDPCVCAGNGLFDEEVVVTSNPGETWTIYANNGYLNPVNGNPYPAGTPLVVNPSNPNQYTLVGQHADGIGYTLTVASLTDTLTISNLCNYPDEPIVQPTITVCQGGSTLIEPQSTGGGMGGNCNATVDMIITGVIDGPLTGGIPKAVEFYVVNDIPDLSLYGFGSANNGGGTDGQEFTFPAGSATAGTYLWVATESTAFTSYFGFAPTYVNTNAPNINGDDAIELFYNGGVIDVFGQISYVGSIAWNYTDGWAYRVDDTGEDGTTFVIGNWIFSGPDALDGTTTNSSANNPMPIGTYDCDLANNPVLFNFYADAGLTILLAGPAVNYNPNTTPANSPQTIWVTAVDDNGCESAPVTVVVTVEAPPVVNAGNNLAFCGIPTFVSISATSTISGSWSTPNGGGLIQNPASASTRYYPVTADIGKTVILRWTTTANHICGPVSDQMGILFVPVTPSAEFDYPEDEYCETDVDPTPVHTTGVDGIYTYTVLEDGPVLAINRNTGVIDIENSDWGTYQVTNTVQGCGNLIITGVLDGNLPGQLPKFVEFYALADIVDLSKYGFSSANNGAGSTNAPEFIFPAVSVTAGTFIRVATEVTAFTQFFGFPPTFTSLAANVNGDDAIELFCNGQVIDVLGDVSYAAGAALPWNYSDGWVYRKNNTFLDGTVYNPANWTISGIGVLTGITQNNLATSPFPIGSYTTTTGGLCPSNTHSVIITIGDTELPEVTCPLNIHQALDPGLCSAWLFWEPPVVTDNCPGEPVITQIAGPPSGSEFTLKNSPVTIEYEIYDANGNGPVYCSFTVRVTGYPEPTTTLACNDEVQISLDRDCSVTLNPDMFLEGGPYSCYNVFEIYVNAPGFENQNLTNLKVEIAPGTYMVTILDPLSGNSCMTTMVLKDKIAPTIECTTCPEGGIIGYNEPVSEYSGVLNMDDYDLLAEIASCWVFDFGPLTGLHPIDVYKVTVSATGSYNFGVISSWGDAELAIYDQEIDPLDMCEGVIGGGNDNGPGFDPIASVVLTAGQTYYIAVSNWSPGQNGTYTLTMSGASGDVLHQDVPIYDPACTYSGCDPKIYTYPLPEVDENCGYTLSYTDEWVEGPICGIYFLRRTYTATDGAGMSASCTMEYLFTGSGLEDLVWPKNWDGLPANNQMIECSAAYAKDQYGNPHPDYTGWPSGFDKSCGRLEVFYTDRVYASDCGPKILRDWVVIDDCWGLIEEWTQIIRITDSTPPRVCSLEPLTVETISTNGWSCMTDYVVPEPLICDNCDENPWYTVESSDGKVVYSNALRRWMVLDLPVGTHTVTYHVYDWCGNEGASSFKVKVYDGIPPTAVCEQYKQVSLTFDGSISSAKVWAESFNSGSHDSDCGPVWFKVLRNDGGCMSFNCDNTACTQQWYDDYVVYCCDDSGKDIMTTLRVFDVNPGAGPVNPSRMMPGGDLYGHYNDCMTTVDVEEKVPPVMICEDITINCEDNIHPDHTGYPTAYATCGAPQFKWTDDLSGLNTCNIGVVVRTWEVLKPTGESYNPKITCKQRITVKETLAFDPLTIVFPYISQESCLKEEPQGGTPTWETNPCNIVEASIIRIDTFRFVEDACYKILREWAVVDWCTYKANTGAEWNLDEYRYISGNRRAILDPAKFTAADRDGYYRFTEVIMVYDNTPAIIDVEDVCLGVATCVTAPELYTITAGSHEEDVDCGGEYEWTYVVKDECCGAVIQYSSNNNAYKGANYQGGVMGKSSLDVLKGGTASFRLLPSLPMGKYIVTWTLSDGCGNVTEAEQWIEVVDKKAPTPFLVDISTAYMDNCMVEVFAVIFDKGACNNNCLASYDNCSEILYFTYTPVLPKIDATWVLDAYGLYYFNPETGAKSTRAQYLLGNAHSWDPVKRSAGRIFGRDAQGNAPLPVVEIRVYVWDQFALNESCDDGNWDYATVMLVLNDEGDDCGPGAGSLVSGSVVQAVTEKKMSDVEVLLDNGSAEYPRHSNTTEGNYQFNEVEQGSYWLEAQKEDLHANGINTLDLIMIQRYLLGMSTNWNIYNLIAADANESGHISGGDIYALRSLILGMKDKLPGGRSWIFIDKGYEFENPAQPWNELPNAERIDLDVNSDKAGNDFVGVKLGDINMTANANVDDKAVEVRNGARFEVEVEGGRVKKGEEFELKFYNGTEMELYGLQWTLGMKDVELVEVIGGKMDVREEHIGRISGDKVTMSWHNVDGIRGDEGQMLFSMRLRALKDVERSASVEITSEVTKSEAYVGKELKIVEPVLGLRGGEGTRFSLYQNEPNPFSAETVVGFDLPEGGNYTLKIMEVSGKVLKEIRADGQKGYNEVTISSKELVSGVLYYQLESGAHFGVKKMIVVQ